MANYPSFLKQRLEKYEAGAADFIMDFNLSRILSAVKNIDKKKTEEFESWNNWCKHIGKMTRLFEKKEMSIGGENEKGD